MQYLKIDGGFVESINQIAHVLGIGTVAESVSSEELQVKIREIGIDHAQGFWISRPRPLTESCGGIRDD